MREDPLRMSLATGAAVLFFLVGLPALAILAVAARLRAKRRAADAFTGRVQESLVAAGFEPLGHGAYRKEGRGLKMEISTNPLFRKELTLRLAAFSNTLHEFELRSGRPVPPEFAAFAPLLGRWPTAGKMFLECYAAGPTSDPDVSADAKALFDLAALPLARSWKGGTFTVREGFEKDVPQWHWRHDVRPKLPRDARRFGVSYWTGSPHLNPPLVRLFSELAGGARMFWISSVEDLQFLELSFPRRDIACWGALLELKNPDMPVAADLHTDGEFFGGLLAARDLPEGFEDERMPRILFHEAAVRALRKCFFYVRRLYDDECSWYSGEYEIVSATPVEVREGLRKVAGEVGAQVLEIDRRFHKRLVVPFDH